VLTCLLVACAIALPAAAQDVDEIIARFVEARGGKEKLDSIQTIRSTGTALFGGTQEQKFLFEWKRPNKIRFELTLQGITEIQASDGETHWTIDPPSQPEPGPVQPAQFAQLNDGVDYIGPLVDYRDKGHTVTLLGKEEIEGTEAYKIEVKKKDGMTEISYLDAEYFLEILQVEKYPMPDGSEMELEVTWSDYKEVAGILLPHSWNRKPRGAPAGLTLTFDGFEINPDIPDSRFAMPSGE
jgi:outer membrane lipoprotein-sorting protein